MVPLARQSGLADGQLRYCDLFLGGFSFTAGPNTGMTWPRGRRGRAAEGGGLLMRILSIFASRLVRKIKAFSEWSRGIETSCLVSSQRVGYQFGYQFSCSLNSARGYRRQPKFWHRIHLR